MSNDRISPRSNIAAVEQTVGSHDAAINGPWAGLQISIIPKMHSVASPSGGPVDDKEEMTIHR